MKALVIGCGAIGRRHIGNLARLRGVTEIFVCSRRKDCLADLEALGEKIKRVDSPDSVNADFAMICNETSRHVAAALPLAERGTPLFIEKPLSHRRREIDRLRRAARRRGTKIFVGYNLRFLGAIRYVKNLIERRALGKLYSCRIEAGQFLPDWRPDRDWRKCYSADSAKGGGVALDLSHELDYMRYFFGDPVGRLTVKSRAGLLPLKAEDQFEAVYRFRSGFLCSVHLDYLQRPARRGFRVVGSRGTVECDLIEKRILITRGTGTRILREKGLFDVTRTYVDELRYFLKSLRSGRKPVPTLADGAKVLELIGGN